MGPFDALIVDASLTGSPAPDPTGVLHALRTRPRPAAGPLLVPDHALAAVGRSAADDLVEVCVLNTGGAGGLLALAGRSVAGVAVVGVVSPLRDLDDLAGNAARVVSAAAELPDELTVFVDIPYAVGWVGAVEEVQAAGLSGALRLDRDSFARAAERLSGLVEADLAFLVAAGVDRALSDGALSDGALSDGAGIGLLPLMLAIEALIDGADASEAAELLALDDAERAGAAVASWDDAAVARIRRRLLGAASRTPDRMIVDLAGSGLLPPS